MFELIEEKCVVAVYRGVLNVLVKIKREDEKRFKKVFGKIEMLAKRCFFNKPEQWKVLKGETCRKFGVRELKPKPYRLAFFKDSYKAKECFIVYAVWRKEGKKKDRKLIEQICGKAQAIKEEWITFKEKEAKNA